MGRRLSQALGHQATRSPTSCGDGLQARINDVCKRAYRALNIRSYARFDLRVTAAGQVYVIEPNVNPCIAADDEIAQSALKVGIAYAALIRMLVRQALRHAG